MPITIRNQTYLDRKEAAEYIKTTAGTLTVWDSTGRYNFHRIIHNRKVHYPISVLDKHLELSLSRSR